MTDKYIKGTPPAVLLPAKNYVFKVEEEHYVIKIPRKGSYHTLAPTVFEADSGDFNIYDEESKIIYLPSITKVLFAVNKYPDLKFNQFFVPYALQIEEEEVIITGQVINMLLPSYEKEKGE